MTRYERVITWLSSRSWVVCGKAWRRLPGEGPVLSGLVRGACAMHPGALLLHCWPLWRGFRLSDWDPCGKAIPVTVLLIAVGCSEADCFAGHRRVLPPSFRLTLYSQGFLPYALACAADDFICDEVACIGKNSFYHRTIRKKGQRSNNFLGWDKWTASRHVFFLETQVTWRRGVLWHRSRTLPGQNVCASKPPWVILLELTPVYEAVLNFTLRKYWTLKLIHKKNRILKL